MAYLQAPVGDVPATFTIVKAYAGAPKSDVSTPVSTTTAHPVIA